jgi:hypothetical protein
MPFLTVLCACAIIFEIGYQAILDQMKANTALNTSNQALSNNNKRSSTELKMLRENQDQISELVSKVTSGIFDTAPDAASFAALTQLGIRPTQQNDQQTPEFFCYSFTGNAEFHRVIPAVATLENGCALLRLKNIELVSNCHPFETKATALSFSGEFYLVRSNPTEKQQKLAH